MSKATHSDAFDVIPFEDIKGDWKKLGSGSFGNVYRGNYLGIDVAIKEVLPSKEYDVAKYFEREWRLMKECRHPNICLFIGLSRAPPPDNRIFIISEFIENGNVRLYIHNKHKPFPWKLRISFATDVARALAYLHARKCIHRDLKGENLLVTANGRLKITDFGFARIAARNAEESKRLTFCGTDSYMSPEILLGEEFDLPTDIFSLGIIFCEIGARQLADDTHFKRHPPSFGIDVAEAKRLMSPGCPPDFFQLCLDCLNTEPSKRPTTRDILDRLRVIEAEVLARPSEGEDMHLGSVRFMTGGKRPTAPRIPSFGMGVGKDIRTNDAIDPNSTDESEDELAEAVMNLAHVNLDSHWSESSISKTPLIDHDKEESGEYSTTVIRSHPSRVAVETTASALSSILTIKAAHDPNTTPDPILPALNNTASASSTSTLSSGKPLEEGDDPLASSSIMSIATMDSYHTAAAAGSGISSAYATEGGSSHIGPRVTHSDFSTPPPLIHRFTLLRPGTKQKRSSGSASPTTGPLNEHHPGWNPLEILFSSGLLVGKCDMCHKRIGWKPVLECDDCGLRTHVKCGELAPMDCGLRPLRQTTHFAMSPLSKVKQSAAQTSEDMKRKSSSPARR